MGGFRILSVATLLVAFVLVLAPGCRDATQVTLDVSLTKLAQCTETKGTAITVGIDPATTEDRVAHEYVTATTSACDQATGEIGTLVLTPSESGRASVIVVVAYDAANAASCKPPLFTGCIVARRQFSFTDHRHLTMPITIDPDCKNVPCDAFSTCRTGKCFSSEAACNGDTCTEPGDPGDGGTAVDGQVIPDTGVPIDGQAADGAGTDGAGPDGSMTDGGDDSRDGGTDGGTDSGPDSGGQDSSTGDSGAPAGVYCDMNGNLFCPDPSMCNAGNAGCLTGAGPLCRIGMTGCMLGETQYCCANAPCPGIKLCQASAVIGAPPPLPNIPSWLVNGKNPVGSMPAGTCQ